MCEPKVAAVLTRLSDTDLVLDVGGWACPFNRAQWILDAQPFATRGHCRTFGGQPFQGGGEEGFPRDTWVPRDICDRRPWPFADRQFDSAVCSHTLEDLRDLIEITGDRVRLIPKYPMIHTERRFHLPKSDHRRLTPRASVQWLWWTDRFDFEEVEHHTHEDFAAELEAFVAATCPVPTWQPRVSTAARGIRCFPRRAPGRLRREMERFGR